MVWESVDGGTGKDADVDSVVVKVEHGEVDHAGRDVQEDVHGLVRVSFLDVDCGDRQR